MKTYLRLFMTIALSVTLAFAAAACAGGGGEEKAEPKGKEEKAEDEDPEKQEKKKIVIKEKKVDTDKIKINTQSSIRIEGSKIVYIDPYKITEKKHDADIVLITHEHYDHFDPDSINSVIKDGTALICPAGMMAKLQEGLDSNVENLSVTSLEPGTEPAPGTLGDNMTLKAVRAYNTNKSYHPKKNNWLGYVLTMDDITYFAAGDTDAIEEHKNVQCDVVFLPIGGTYTMTAEEAAKDVNAMKKAPKVAIPIHYGSIVGSAADAETFRKNVKDGIKVVTKVEDAR